MQLLYIDWDEQNEWDDCDEESTGLQIAETN